MFSRCAGHTAETGACAKQLKMIIVVSRVRACVLPTCTLQECCGLAEKYPLKIVNLTGLKIVSTHTHTINFRRNYMYGSSHAFFRFKNNFANECSFTLLKDH